MYEHIDEPCIVLTGLRTFAPLRRNRSPQASISYTEFEVHPRLRRGFPPGVLCPRRIVYDRRRREETTLAEDGKMARNVIDAKFHAFWDVARVAQKSRIVVGRPTSLVLVLSGTHTRQSRIVHDGDGDGDDSSTPTHHDDQHSVRTQSQSLPQSTRNYVAEVLSQVRVCA